MVNSFSEKRSAAWPVWRKQQQKTANKSSWTGEVRIHPLANNIRNITRPFGRVCRKGRRKVNAERTKFQWELKRDPGKSQRPVGGRQNCTACCLMTWKAINCALVKLFEREWSGRAMSSRSSIFYSHLLTLSYRTADAMSHFKNHLRPLDITAKGYHSSFPTFSSFSETISTARKTFFG